MLTPPSSTACPLPPKEWFLWWFLLGGTIIVPSGRCEMHAGRVVQERKYGHVAEITVMSAAEDRLRAYFSCTYVVAYGPG